MDLDKLKSETTRIVDEIFSVLKVKKGRRNYLSRYFDSILRKIDKKMVRESQFDLVRLEYFLKHLKEIETQDDDVMSNFSKEFRRVGQESQFYGLRFEAYVAASLVRKGISFEKSEAPDFLLDELGIGIECSSIRVLGNMSRKDLSYKVESVIRKKSSTESNSINNMLFIDMTNVVYNSELPNLNNLRPSVQKALSVAEFSSVVLFSHHFNHDLGRYETVYIREDAVNASQSVKEFLDEYYPVKSHRVYNFEIMPEG